MNEYDFFGEFPVRTKSGQIVWTSYNRIVHGGRGAYVEFLDVYYSIRHVPKNQMWRFKSPKAFYEWWETDNGVKIYHQLKPVDYADYVVGRWYIAPTDLEGFEVVGKYDYNKP